MRNLKTGVLFGFGMLYITSCVNSGNNSQSLPKDPGDTIHQMQTKYEEDFNAGLSNHWVIQDYSFPESGCEMLDSQVTVKHSILTLEFDLNTKGKEKPYKSGEVSLIYPFLYGRFTVCLKNQIAPGTVSSFFIMNKWQPENWEHKEIDIEFLGKHKRAVQFNVHHFKNGGREHVDNPYLYQLGFDSSDGYHEYTIEWRKDSISFFVDGKLAHTEKRILIDEQMYIRMNHWATTSNFKLLINWMGHLDTTKLPSKINYDYIRYTPLK
jgi:endo-1,3-1,4-beta-glycanase ExoK